jgi:hypothetical protein
MKFPKLNKAKLLLTIPLAILSLRIYLGAVFGYFFARFMAERLDSVILSFGSYHLHFHHWMMGLVGVLFFLLYEFSPSIEYFIFGFLGGLIFQGVTSYPDWYRILKKGKD